MATYKGIQGYSVQELASDPTSSENTGRLWYNSASNVWKIASEGGGAWASGVSFTRVVTTDGKFSGTSTATLFAGGYAPAGVHSPPLSMDYTETFDGTSWTEVADLNTPRYAAWMAGTQTASVYAGGQSAAPSALSETWNGTSWTETNNMQNSRHNMGIAGTQTSGLAIAGLDGTPTGDCEDYDGTCWGTGTGINSARYSAGSAGASSTSAIFAGGADGSTYYNILSETWNGTTWTEGNNINTGRYALGGFGIVTSALICAGYKASGSPRSANETETYDGTSWTAAATMGTARYSPGATGGPGGISTGIIGGGNGSPTPSGLTQECEEWADPTYTLKTVTTS